MKRHNIYSLGVLTALLCGCSSPPEAPPVDWHGPVTAINHALPDGSDNLQVIPAENVAGHWVSRMHFFDAGQLWPPDVWFAVVHSTAIQIDAPDTGAYFRAKSWLLQHGATAKVISFRHTPALISQTMITLSR